MFNEKTYSQKMDKTIEIFQKELTSLRTGRANASMLDLVKVDVYGQGMPLNQVSSITTPDARTINIQVWDLNNVPLIDNAIKYGPNGNRINVGAKLEKDHVVLWVSDNGPGILESDKERVLERFTRLDTSRNTQGTGLGLSLVSSSIKFHNGKISLLDSNPNGLIVKLELPKSF